MVGSVSRQEIRFVVVELDLAEIWDGVLAFSKDNMAGGTGFLVKADSDGPVLYKPDRIGVFKRRRYGRKKPFYIFLRLYGLAYTASGSISGEGFTDIPGSSLIDLSSSVKYPNHPDVTAQLTSFEYANIGDNYGGHVRGYICAPATGNYIFYLASDDQSELWLSTNDDPANIRRIAYIDRAVGFRAWFSNLNQRSVPIRL